MSPAPGRRLEGAFRWQARLNTDEFLRHAARVIARSAGRHSAEPAALVLEGPDGTLGLQPADGVQRVWNATLSPRWASGRDSRPWCGALLDANAALLRSGAIAFALDEGQAPVLLARLYAGSQRAPALLRELHVLVDAAAAFNAVTSIERSLALPLARAALARFIAGGLESEPATPDVLLERLIEAGLSPVQAFELASGRPGSEHEGDLRVECVDRGRALLASVALGEGLLAASGVPALRANIPLLGLHGVALARGAEGPFLGAHWPGSGCPRHAFMSCLRSLAGLPGCLRDPRFPIEASEEGPDHPLSS